MSGGQACVCVSARSCSYECLGSGLCVCVQGMREAARMSVWGQACVCVCVCARDGRSCLYECLGSTVLACVYMGCYGRHEMNQ